jgi:hypothetical protein
MRKHLIILALAMVSSGCAMLKPKSPQGAPVAAAPASEAAPLVVLGQTAASLDTTTPAQKAAALAKPAVASGVDLGLMVVALGSPAEAGFWLSGGSVVAPGKGRVVTSSGASVAVDLRAGTGGALLSLAAFRALGLGLTDLPEVRVFAN